MKTTLLYTSCIEWNFLSNTFNGLILNSTFLIGICSLEAHSGNEIIVSQSDIPQQDHILGPEQITSNNYRVEWETSCMRH